jgi:hypothetical protein
MLTVDNVCECECVCVRGGVRVVVSKLEKENELVRSDWKSDDLQTLLRI